ncbi:hypothetical protein J4402_01810 [Candidatus Pacearchaeota archaeon]|nr:hypothetical protein [Candidatus Pacearchaeota archaeon]
MSLFKERGPDVVDLVDLQKRGILKKSSQQPERHEDDFVDFSKQSSPQTAPPSSFDFLNSLASSAPSSSSQEPQPQMSDSQVASLKVKLEDLEYKLDRFIDRIIALESKLNRE